MNGPKSFFIIVVVAQVLKLTYFFYIIANDNYKLYEFQLHEQFFPNRSTL
jgi:hypothetical protein